VRIDLEPDLRALAAEWDALADAVGAPPFLRPGWFDAWWGAFGRGNVAALTARDGSGLRALLPVAKSHGALVSPTNDHSPAFGLLAAGDDAALALARALAGRPEESVRLTHLDERSAGIVTRGAGRRLVTSRGAIDSPSVDVVGTWEAYEAALSKNLRADLRRRRRRLDEAGTVTIDLNASPDRLDEGLAVEGSGWKDAAGTAIRSRPETLAFYRALAAWAAARGTLRLCFLHLDGKPLAFHFDLADGGVVYHLKGGYDPEYERFSPGKLLHRAAVEDAWRRSCRRYEFLGAPDAYKLQFANASTRLVHLQLFRRTPVGAAGFAVVAWARPLAKRVVVSARATAARRAPRRGPTR
jgi:CelD/BcsL family acetyltransferase involved in cellulose biosynthesis